MSPETSGALELASVPAPADGKAIAIAVALPYERDASGLAVAPCGGLFVAVTAEDRIVYNDGLCGGEASLPNSVAGPSDAPGHFIAPRGLACMADSLWIADGGNYRLQSLAFPRLEPNAAWSWPETPLGAAVDSEQRVLIVDGSTLRRIRPDGAEDAAFAATLAAAGLDMQPGFVACSDAGHVLVSDLKANEVRLFAADGSYLGDLTGPAGWLPGALACGGRRTYVADAATGFVQVFEDEAGTSQWLGPVPGWSGPVTALATAADGSLYIKPDLGTSYFRVTAASAYVTKGNISAGPFDAGEEMTWERVWAEADLPAGTDAVLEIAAADSAQPDPAASDWVVVPARDALLSQLVCGERRFVWLRATLTASADRKRTPTLRQVRAATASENYLDHLPQTYRRADSAVSGVLDRWLKLLRGEYAGVEEALEDMSRVADPDFADSATVEWLAQWMGLELPLIADDAGRRALIADAVRLFARRGTPASIAEFVELHTGIRPAVIEAFAERRIWQLGTHSCLGFDTQLPPLDPLGAIVPDPAVESGCCPASPAAVVPSLCSPCADTSTDAVVAAPVVAMGRTIVGESGPLADYQIGMPLFAEEAYRFCVVVDAYRVADPATLQEVVRIVEREKPAHTDYRIEVVAPELRVGYQARIGVDTIVGGEPPSLQLDVAALNRNTQLPPSDVARVGAASLDGSLTLN